MKNYTLFADGSCPVPHFAGGWAYILRSTETKEEIIGSGGEKNTTNNRAELLSVIRGLQVLTEPSIVKIVSDSQYVVHGLTKWRYKWKKQNWTTKDYETGEFCDVKNVDLWKQLDELAEQHKIIGEWVRGHDGHVENERCDRMAGDETKKINMAEEARLVVESKLPPPTAVQ